jgi:hypothetical protein
VPNATFPSYDEMDDGDIGFANNSNDGLYDDIGELMLFADVLKERLATIAIEDADLVKEAAFTADFYGALVRYYLAAYYALTPDQPGGPLDGGPFVPASELYNQAITMLNAASANADADQKRVINTTIARIHLFQGNYGDARAAAANGMADGDAPFASQHVVENSNVWYVQAGIGRTQWVVDFRYKDYVDADPNEANRVKLEEIMGNDGTTVYWRQAMYPDRATPLNFATWQENELMLAELDIRDGNAASALDRVNAVRASHGIAALDAIDMDGLIVEREKELFTMGMRLPDQRRFDLWHLPDGPWKYLPITQSERNGNENL